MLKPKGFLLSLILIVSFFTFLQAFIVHYIPPVEAAQYDWETNGGSLIGASDSGLVNYKRIGFWDGSYHRVFYLGDDGNLRAASSTNGTGWTTELAVGGITTYNEFDIHWDGSIVHLAYCNGWDDDLDYKQGTPDGTGWAWAAIRTVEDYWGDGVALWRYDYISVSIQSDTGYPYIVATGVNDRGANTYKYTRGYRGNNEYGSSWTETSYNILYSPGALWNEYTHGDLISLSDGKFAYPFYWTDQPGAGGGGEMYAYYYNGSYWLPENHVAYLLDGETVFGGGGAIGIENDDIAVCGHWDGWVDNPPTEKWYSTHTNTSGGWESDYNYAVNVTDWVKPSPYDHPTFARETADRWHMTYGNDTGLWRTTYNRTIDSWSLADEPFGNTFTERNNETSMYRNGTSGPGIGVMWLESYDATPYNLMFGLIEQEASDTDYEVTTQIRINGYSPYTSINFTIDDVEYEDGDIATLSSSEFGESYALDGTPVTHLEFLNWTITAGTLSVANDDDPTTDLSVLSDGTLTLHLNATVDITHNRTGITNFDCLNWTITEYRYYAFESEYICTNSYLDTAEWSFLDFAARNVTAYFTNSTSEGVYDYSLDYANTGKNGTYSYSWLNLTDQTLNVTVYLWLKQPLLDLLNVDLYVKANCSGYGMTNSTGGFELAQADYFNLYSYGGLEHSRTGFSDPSEPLGGHAGRIDGGDYFNLYCYNNSFAESYQYWRGLVHYQMLLEIQWDFGSTDHGDPWGVFGSPPSTDFPDDFHFFFGWAYYARGEWIENRDSWIDLDLIGFGWGADYQYSLWGYQVVMSGNTIYNDYLIGWFDEGSHSWKLWVDFWFNEANASSMAGIRTTSYWYAVENNCAWWQRPFIGNDWGALYENMTMKTTFETMYAEDGEPLSSIEIEMVRLRCRVEQFVSDYNYSCQIWKIPQVDMTFDSTMRGIPTPPYQPPQSPSMPMGGFIGVIYSALMAIGDMLGPGLMAAWYGLVDLLDGTVGAWLGQPQFFSWFFTQAGNLWTYMVDSFSYALTLLLSFFAFLAVTMSKFATVVGLGFNTWASMFTMGIGLLDSGFNSGIDIWNGLGIYQWLTLCVIFYPLWLIDLWDQEGLQAVLDHIMFLVNIFSFLVNLMIRIAQFGVTTITQLIEIIPVVE